MQRFIMLVIFLVFMIFSVQTSSLIYKFDYTDSKVDLISCSYFDISEIQCGNFYVVHNNTTSILNFGESIILQEELDVSKCLENNNCELISQDYLEEQDLTFYLLYDSNLPKYKVIDNKKYNLQIAVKNNYTKIGYPAIFDSFWCI